MVQLEDGVQIDGAPVLETLQALGIVQVRERWQQSVRRGHLACLLCLLGRRGTAKFPSMLQLLTSVCCFTLAFEGAGFKF